MTEGTGGTGGAWGAPLPALGGGRIDLAEHAGPVLVVNSASLCGFTGQYAGLERLWRAYRDRGLLVVAVPSDDFGHQEPGGAAEITACTARFAVSFPVAAKAHVRGPRATPLFAWLAGRAGWLGRPRWNFYKYLIGPDGELAAWFPSFVAPDGRRVRRAVERALADAGGGGPGTGEGVV